MANKRVALLFLILAMQLTACNLIGQKDAAEKVMPADAALVSAALPPAYAAGAPLPSPGGAGLRSLNSDDAALDAQIANFEALEREALAQLVEKITRENATSSHPTPAQGLKTLALPVLPESPPALTAQDSNPAMDAAKTAGALMMVTSYVSDMVTPHLAPGAKGGGSVSQTEEGTTATMNMDLGMNPDGSSRFELGIKTESATAKTVFSSQIEGLRCPNAAGKVSFTAKIHMSAEGGGGVLDQQLTAIVKADVDDEANIIGFTMDVIQGTRQVKAGREVYVESGETITASGMDFAGAKSSNLRIIRASQAATFEDNRTLSGDGHTAAMIVGASALKAAESNWLNGGCIKLEAPAPGMVKPGSETAIPVKVMHLIEKAEVSARLKVELSGGKLIEPAQLPQTPGALTYTAPDEKNQSATIILTAVSRRGKARLELPVNTGGNAYRISGEHVGNSQTYAEDVCDTSMPFKVEGVPEFDFFPMSENTGYYTYADKAGKYSGNGTYTINEDGSMSLVCLVEMIDAGKGGAKQNVLHTWKAEPIDPAICAAQ